MADDPAVALAGVSKRYWKLEEQAMLLRSVLPMWRPKRSELWALRDANLSVRRGETVGIIGHNGAGKTTMLRLLAGVTQPTLGHMRVIGRIAPLISVGVGFHREMSGRENVFVNGMLLGLTKRQVEMRFDQIVEFAGLADFIDTPVKFYSSGMFMRLGFAVAVCSDPDVLLVDEVLAVGDIAFQLKCFERMRELQANGTTIILVSHSTHAIRLLCPRTLLLAGGTIRYDGQTQEAIGLHHQLLSANGGSSDDGASGAAVSIIERSVVGPDGPTFHLPHNRLIEYKARLRFERAVDSPQLQFQVYSQTGTFVYGHRTFLESWRRFRAGDIAQVSIPFQQRLGGDTYRLVLNVLSWDGDPLYSDSEGVIVYVEPRAGSVGLVDLGASLVVDKELLSRDVDLLLDTRLSAGPTSSATEVSP